ncbi:phytanoyl-CoA dioxygenase family protein [Ovoidimarina sediminis]|uniref:phytanoyl-CoA dioxygenase family protein n=1 Tax=Ovoidimarina sediminis TaxID=3079856 RepID=UPI0029096EA6|nr:phytanoyl-CoA dioxygenase family protein [Rhodophyticola sp. MJ-SS7]MDU8944560.1 phytanoyl-CoA dioxygenase family protein [Rhodophyticola sp. MJ-SS7]
MDLDGLAARYRLDGYISGIPVLTGAEAATHRRALEKAEAEQGPLHYKAKLHTVMTSPLALATHPRVLDVVEALIGPDILLYDVTYIIKEPHTASHVSWHQDLTYWGLSDDAQVSMWLALSPATEVSGCMRMVPGSHLAGRLEHETGEDADNVLFQSQTVHGVDEGHSVICPLAPGEASFHHGWVLHASMPNRSDDRRIGLNVQYIAPHVRQTKHDRDSVMLVRGEDRYGHFMRDVPATANFAPETVARWHELDRLHIETQGTS